MRVMFEGGLYYFKAPGAVIWSENKDLLWEGYMTLVICHPELIRDVTNPANVLVR